MRKAGEGTIVTLPSGRKRVGFSLASGEREWLDETFATHEEADEMRIAALTRLRAEGIETKGLTLKNFGPKVLDRRELAGYRATESATSVFNAHVATAPFADWPMSNVRSPQIREWLRGVKASAPKGRRKTAGAKRGRADSTATNAINLMRAIFDAALEDEKIAENPCRDVGLPKRMGKTTEERIAFRELELDALLACATDDEQDLIEVAAGTGIRQGEQIALRLVDVHAGEDEKAPHLWIRYGGAPNKPTKGGKPRRVPLFGRALQAMRRWLKRLPEYCPDNPKGLAFPTQGGGYHYHNVTERQLAVLRAIADSHTRGVSPTLREIGKTLGFVSTNGVTDHLNALERKGLIVRPRAASGLARSSRLTREGAMRIGAEVNEPLDDGTRGERKARPGTYRKTGQMLGRVYVGMDKTKRRNGRKGKAQYWGRPVYVDRWEMLIAHAELADDHDRHFVWHSLRHTAACDALSGKWGHRWTKEDVQKLLGHVSITTTEIYAKMLDDTLTEVALITERSRVMMTRGGASKNAGDFQAPPAGIGPAANGLGKLSTAQSFPVVIPPCDQRVISEFVLAVARRNDVEANRLARVIAEAVLEAPTVRLARAVLEGGPHALDRALDLAELLRAVEVEESAKATG